MTDEETTGSSPLAGSWVHSDSYRAHAQMLKAIKLASVLITNGITLEDAINMGESLWRMFERTAGVHESSETTWGIVMLLLRDEEEKDA